MCGRLDEWMVGLITHHGNHHSAMASNDQGTYHTLLEAGVRPRHCYHKNHHRLHRQHLDSCTQVVVVVLSQDHQGTYHKIRSEFLSHSCTQVVVLAAIELQKLSPLMAYDKVLSYHARCAKYMAGACHKYGILVEPRPRAVRWCN